MTETITVALCALSVGFCIGRCWQHELHLQAQQMATDAAREKESQKQSTSNMTDILNRAGQGVVYRRRFRI